MNSHKSIIGDYIYREVMTEQLFAHIQGGSPVGILLQRVGMMDLQQKEEWVSQEEQLTKALSSLLPEASPDNIARLIAEYKLRVEETRYVLDKQNYYDADGEIKDEFKGKLLLASMMTVPERIIKDESSSPRTLSDQVMEKDRDLVESFKTEDPDFYKQAFKAQPIVSSIGRTRPRSEIEDKKADPNAGTLVRVGTTAESTDSDDTPEPKKPKTEDINRMIEPSYPTSGETVPQIESSYDAPTSGESSLVVGSDASDPMTVEPDVLDKLNDESSTQMVPSTQSAPAPGAAQDIRNHYEGMIQSINHQNRLDGDTLRAQVSQLNNQLFQSQAEKTALSSDIGRLQGEIRQIYSDNQSKVSQESEFQGRLSAYATTNMELQAQLRAKEKEMTELHSQLDSHMKTDESLDSLRATHAETIGKLEKTIEEKQATINEMNQEKLNSNKMDIAAESDRESLVKNHATVIDNMTKAHKVEIDAKDLEIKTLKESAANKDIARTINDMQKTMADKTMEMRNEILKKTNVEGKTLEFEMEDRRAERALKAQEKAQEFQLQLENIKQAKKGNNDGEIQYMRDQFGRPMRDNFGRPIPAIPNPALNPSSVIGGSNMKKKKGDDVDDEVLSVKTTLAFIKALRGQFTEDLNEVKEDYYEPMMNERKKCRSN